MDESSYKAAVSVIRDHAAGGDRAYTDGARSPQLELAVVRIGAQLARSANVADGFVEALSGAGESNMVEAVLHITDQILHAVRDEGIEIDDLFDSMPSQLAFRDIALNEQRHQ
ncbi:hypothetical protein [Rhodococcus sp. IEGM 1330]|uniref:hypothetical protein n=1 Tax=Rhodococcus sp. IEGM 1330 TaxID=3082225 RepID=UPI002953EBCE|nr:hypothetical protein [Rhodococcus sp. IEGM 1330]MDV8024960.1 hypothetical protein [Rhodococcus sp. IEGM 1330]